MVNLNKSYVENISSDLILSFFFKVIINLLCKYYLNF